VSSGRALSHRRRLMMTLYRGITKLRWRDTNIRDPSTTSSAKKASAGRSRRFFFPSFVVFDNILFYLLLAFTFVSRNVYKQRKYSFLLSSVWSSNKFSALNFVFFSLAHAWTNHTHAK